MKVVLGFDGLGLEPVKIYDLPFLKQKVYCKTSLAEYRGEGTYTPVIWGSMLTGEIDRSLEDMFINRARRRASLIETLQRLLLPRKLTKLILWLGDEVMARTKGGMPTLIVAADWLRLKEKRTIFDDIRSWHNTIPGYDWTYGLKEVRLIQKALSGDQHTSNKLVHVSFETYRLEKTRLLNALLDRNYELVFFYTKLMDDVGHIQFGNRMLMKHVYFEANELAREVVDCLEKGDILYIISDHGMKPLGRFGLHTKHGFFSSNTGQTISKPTELYSLLRSEIIAR